MPVPPPEIIPGGHGYGTYVQEVVSICKEWVYYEIGQAFLNYSMCQKSYPFIKNEFAMKIGQDSLDIHFNETKVNQYYCHWHRLINIEINIFSEIEF